MIPTRDLAFSQDKISCCPMKYNLTSSRRLKKSNAHTFRSSKMNEMQIYASKSQFHNVRLQRTVCTQERPQVHKLVCTFVF